MVTHLSEVDNEIDINVDRYMVWLELLLKDMI
jgi:hypothetical protein